MKVSLIEKVRRYVPVKNQHSIVSERMFRAFPAKYEYYGEYENPVLSISDGTTSP